ncbi:MAG: hypothetical protein CSYNP_01133 [Syntrophus sp. SKADARSKE-3]|nr:hypothetical protein [Syntrophus sp. SKADARSKE-3]
MTKSYGVLFSAYRFLTGWIHTRWLGGLQAGFIIRSVYIQKAIQSLDHSKKMFILDVGSGEKASISAVLARRYAQHHFVATDLFFNPPLPKLSNLDIIVQNVQSPCLKNQEMFDVIFSLDMLEHLEEPKQVLEHFSVWLRARGLLFLHTPSGNEKNIFRGAGAGLHPGFRPMRPGDQHLREGFSINELRNWLQELGFQVRRASFTVGPMLLFFKELYTLGERRRIPGIGICMLPYIFLMTSWEMIFPPSSGNGIWIIAEKIKTSA